MICIILQQWRPFFEISRRPKPPASILKKLSCSLQFLNNFLRHLISKTKLKSIKFVHLKLFKLGYYCYVKCKFTYVGKFYFYEINELFFNYDVKLLPKLLF